MKRVIIFFLLTAFTVLAVNAEKNQKADASASQIIWTGKKVTGQHTGTILLREGYITVDGNAITGGEFIIDMSSIKNTDLKDEKTRGMLEGHLKSDDFFGVEKFPLSNLVITGSELKLGKMTVKGNLTIKGKTNPIEFTTVETKEGDAVVYTAVITVDRSEYDVRYGSGKFFSNLGDKVIYDEFTLDVKLVLQK